MVNTDTNALPLSQASVALGDIRMLDPRPGGRAELRKGVNVLVVQAGQAPSLAGAQLSAR